MNDNEMSTVNNDNGVTYTASLTHSAWIKGTVWSMGLGCEVQVIGHSSDQSEDVWLVSRDLDGDGSPDTAQRRAGSDLAPLYKIGDVVTILVQTDSSVAPQMTLGLVTSRSSRGIYLHTGYSMFNDNGAVVIGWEDARARFERGEEFQLQHNHTATFLNLLHRKAQEEAKAKAEAAIEADRIRDQFTDFKRQVEVVASRYGREHEMCDVLDQCLGELGLERIKMRWAVEVTVTKTVLINADNEDKASERVRYLLDGATLEFSGMDDGEDLDDDYGSTSTEVSEGSAYDE